MNRPRLNFIIDVTAFISGLLMTSSGFVLRYLLPPGSGRLESAGHGFGALRRPITLLWGFTRHEWGTFHYAVSLVLLTVLSAHLLLHGRWLLCMMKGQAVENRSGLRFFVGIFALIALLAFAAAPFFTSTETVSRGELLEQRGLN